MNTVREKGTLVMDEGDQYIDNALFHFEDDEEVGFASLRNKDCKVYVITATCFESHQQLMNSVFSSYEHFAFDSPLAFVEIKLNQKMDGEAFTNETAAIAGFTAQALTLA